jgi:glycosyltransferase involved in cell wall biosynthesis
MISVLVLTRNEAQDITACIESVRWSDDVHVFDSGSMDQTQEIARNLGATVTERKFDGYASQRNAALDTLPFKHEWIFILDADERPSPELGAEMLRIASETAQPNAAYKVRRRDYLWDTWLEHAQISPWYIRLVRRGKARYTREVNEVLEVDGTVGELVFPLEHYPFSKGIRHWIDKHNVYSTMEAETIADGLHLNEASWHAAFFEKDFHAKRRAQKALFFRMPMRPLLKWCYMMFYRGAVLDGPPGVVYATLQSIYEYFIVLKTREILYARTSQKR